MGLQEGVDFILDLFEIMRKHGASFGYDEYPYSFFSLATNESITLETGWSGEAPWIVEFSSISMDAGRDIGGRVLGGKIVLSPDADIRDDKDLGAALWARVIYKIESDGSHGWFVGARARNIDTATEEERYFPIDRSVIFELLEM